MSKTIVILLVIVIAVSTGAFVFMNQQNKEKDAAMMAKTDTMMKPTDGMEKESSTMMKDASSRYVTFSSDTLMTAKEKKRVLFFYASWCPTCIPADANFTEKSTMIPEDMVVIRVNYNDPETDAEEKELAKKYGVTYQHTFVQIDENDTIVTKWNGGQIEELLAQSK